VSPLSTGQRGAIYAKAVPPRCFRSSGAVRPAGYLILNSQGLDIGEASSRPLKGVLVRGRAHEVKSSATARCYE
jgi:hypothetical protein